MPFAHGADVVVTALRKKGRVLDVDGRGRYRVAVGGMTIWCAEAELELVARARKPARRERETGAASRGQAEMSPAPGTPNAQALGSLDLHGLTVPEALHALEVRLDQAIRAGLERVEIIHGISGGRLRAAVRGYLAGATGIGGFAPDARNPGVTWVYL
jgi:DNA mismatch repair protein MutS2